MASLDETVIRIKSLWTTASYYLRLAQGLRNEPRKHDHIWNMIAQGKPRRRDVQALLWSAHLVSASLRLTSIEELVIGNPKVLRKRAYAKFDPAFIHVYLRDQTAHPMMEAGHQEKWKVRKPGLQKLALSKCLKHTENAQARLKIEITRRYNSTGDIPEWVTSQVGKWLDLVERPSKET